MSITLNHDALNRARIALAVLAAERNYVSMQVAVKVARIHGVVRKAWEPIDEAHQNLVAELGEVDDVKCPHCREVLFRTDQPRVLPNGPNWKRYKDAEKELLQQGEVVFEETLLLSELKRFVVNPETKQRERDQRGVAKTEPIPLNPDEIEALGELLIIDVIDGDSQAA